MAQIPTPAPPPAVRNKSSGRERVRPPTRALAVTGRADAAQRELLTRRLAKAEAQRRKLLDAYYAGAIDVRP